MKKLICLVLLAATPALAGWRDSRSALVPGGFCTVNPGRKHSTVVCDYELGLHPKHKVDVRARVLIMQKRRGQARCIVTDVYDPGIPTIREGRILETETVCFGD